MVVEARKPRPAVAAAPMEPQSWFSEPAQQPDRSKQRPWTYRRTEADGTTKTTRVSDKHKGPGGMTPHDVLSA